MHSFVTFYLSLWFWKEKFSHWKNFNLDWFIFNLFSNQKKWKDFPASRLLDLKLKCIFDFTEAEQSRLPNLQHVSESTILPSSKEGTTPKSDSQKQSHSTSASTNLNQSATKANSIDTFTTAVDVSHGNDFDSSLVKQKLLNTSNPNTNSPNSNNANIRPEKNDNTINELKLLKQENEMFKKEITRLKVANAFDFFLRFVFISKFKSIFFFLG